MSDLISRQAAIDALDGELTITGRENAKTILDYVNGVNKKLRELPSAERRGRWERKGYHLHCSCCDWSTDLATPYCPGCGAYLGGDAK